MQPTDSSQQPLLNEQLRTDALSVHDFICFGAPAGCAEERSAATDIVLPRDGLYVRRNRLGQAYADRTAVLFFEFDDTYEISHPVPKPDSSTVISLSRRLIDELCTLPGQDASPFFGFGSTRTNSRIMLAHNDLLISISRSGRADRLELEEKALHLVAEVFHWLWKQRPAAAVRKSAAPHRAEPRENRLISEVLLYLNENFRDQLTLDDIATSVGRSRFHLCRTFRSSIGHTIHRHLTELRLRSALDLLADTRKSITEIALDLGYSSHSHFTAQFRQAFRITPKSYRNEFSRRFP